MTRRMPRAVRRATHLALSWARWYTRDLTPAIAGDRRDEIASDVWEQAAGQADRPAAVLAASIVGRVVRGIPADLAWRWNVRPARSGIRAPLVVRSALATAIVLAVLELALGSLALGRVVIALGRGEPLPSETTVASAIAGMLVLVAGLALVARTRTRAVGLLGARAGCCRDRALRDSCSRDAQLDPQRRLCAHRRDGAERVRLVGARRGRPGRLPRGRRDLRSPFRPDGVTS